MSQAWEYIKIALMNLKSNKGRSILTMLGIIIGISSVIMVISIGNGVKGQINQELNDMAGGMVELYVNNSGNADNSDYLEFTMDDMEALEEKLDHIKGVSPVFGMWGSVSGRKGEFQASVYGGTTGFQYYNKEPIIKGRYYNTSDYFSANKVCVMSESSAKQLFGTTDVIGMSVSISLYGTSHDFRIVGIRRDSEAGLLSAMNGASRIEIDVPLSVIGSAYGYYVETFNDIVIFGESPEYSSAIASKAVSILETRHGVRGENLIIINDMNVYIQQYDTILGGVTLFIVFVAAISLLVGGIGVMNIMLVSVTERTREIGIRKSLGARTGSILLQFLSESAVITLVGGIIGIILGSMGAVGVCSLMNVAADVQAGTVLAATIFSSGVGIFFGIYPAKKAAKLSPIEALRHE